jgi:hypothetical protein
VTQFCSLISRHGRVLSFITDILSNRNTLRKLRTVSSPRLSIIGVTTHTFIAPLRSVLFGTAVPVILQIIGGRSKWTHLHRDWRLDWHARQFKHRLGIISTLPPVETCRYVHRSAGLYIAVAAVISSWSVLCWWKRFSTRIFNGLTLERNRRAG